MVKRGGTSAKNRGESMVFVVIILFVFVAVGIALMSAGFAARASAVQREKQLQSYYCARSVLDTLDDSLRDGKLGEELRARALASLIPEERAEFDSYVSLSAEAVNTGLDGLAIADMEISYSGKSSVILDDEGNSTSFYVAFDSIVIPVKVDYYGEEYTITARYNGYGFYEPDEQGEWRWTTAWTVESLG